MSKINDLMYLAGKCANDHSLTCYEVFDTDSNYFWAIVFGFNEETNSVMGKVAYCPKKSAMQEYDMDWMMPYDKDTGCVDDTEVCVEDSSDILHLIQQSDRFINEYVGKYKEDK